MSKKAVGQNFLADDGMPERVRILKEPAAPACQQNEPEGEEEQRRRFDEGAIGHVRFRAQSAPLRKPFASRLTKTRYATSIAGAIQMNQNESIFSAFSNGGMLIASQKRNGEGDAACRFGWRAMSAASARSRPAAG